MGEFKFEVPGFGGKKRKDSAKGSGSPEKKENEKPNMEKASGIKKEINEIIQGKDLEDLELEDLNKVLDKYKEIQSALGMIEKEPSGDIREQMDMAREIMGEDFFGLQEVEKSFGAKVEAEKIPEIPFSREDLERARGLNQFLVLRVDKTSDGKPLTSEKMKEIFKKTADKKPFFYDQNWYEGEEFFTKETPQLSWALASKEIIPNSTSKNYLQQTQELVDYIKNQVFKEKKMPEKFQSALNEFERKHDEIEKILGSDWQKAGEMLSSLEINKISRQTPVEALYDLIIYFQNRGKRLLENKYTWTSRRDSDGGLVGVGKFDSGGVSVGSGGPDYSGVSLGVSFSRSF